MAARGKNFTNLARMGASFNRPRRRSRLRGRDAISPRAAGRVALKVDQGGPMTRALYLAIALALSGAPAAQAQEAIATAAAIGPHDAPDPATIPPPGPLNENRTHYDDGGPALVMGPCGPTAPAKDGQGPDHKPHGQVDVAVGTGGYRHVAGVVCQPLGDHSSVTIAAGKSQWRERARGW
jgi:hypothetical protein